MPRITHPFAPVFDARSRVLILGTIPSPASRTAAFYYAHPQNRFWPLLAALFGVETPQTTETRQAFALAHGIALWDVLAACDIAGASDSTIRNPVPNDFSPILQSADIRAIFATGRKAQELYMRLCALDTGIPCRYLPSPSPANCAVSFNAMRNAYQEILEYLE